MAANNDGIRAPFVFDGRASTLLGSTAADDKLALLDSASGDIKTIEFSELATALGTAGGFSGGWIPEPDESIQSPIGGSAPAFVLAAADAGKNIVVPLDDGADSAALTFDLDNLPDGEFVFVTVSHIGSSFAGGPASLDISNAGALVWTGPGFTGGGETGQMASIQVIFHGTAIMGFYRSGSSIYMAFGATYTTGVDSLP